MMIRTAIFAIILGTTYAVNYNPATTYRYPLKCIIADDSSESGYKEVNCPTFGPSEGNSNADASTLFIGGGSNNENTVLVELPNFFIGPPNFILPPSPQPTASPLTQAPTITNETAPPTTSPPTSSPTKTKPPSKSPTVLPISTCRLGECVACDTNADVTYQEPTSAQDGSIFIQLQNTCSDGDSVSPPDGDLGIENVTDGGCNISFVLRNVPSVTVPGQAGVIEDQNVTVCLGPPISCAQTDDVNAFNTTACPIVTDECDGNTGVIVVIVVCVLLLLLVIGVAIYYLIWSSSADGNKMQVKN